MKRVLVISQHFPPEKSGNASRIGDLTANLSKLGFAIRVLSPPPTFPWGYFKKTKKLKKCYTSDSIDIINLWTWQPASRDPRFASRMAYYLVFSFHVVVWMIANRTKFDIVMTSIPPLFDHIPGFFAKKIFKKQWIADVRDLWIDASIGLGFIKKGGTLEIVSRRFEKICCTIADVVSVTTNNLKKKLNDTYDLREKRNVIVVPNGVDTDFFYFYEREKKKQIIYTGNIGHAQDLENVVLAMKYVRDIHDIKFLIAGDGDVKKKLEEIVKIEELDDTVVFRGVVPREDIPKMLSESLIGIAPLKKIKSLEYAIPTKAYEYMACELPFVCCGIGEITKLAEESGGGVIADNNPKAIARKISELLNNPEEMVKMGKKGREFVERFYDRKKIALELKQHIEMIS